LTGWTGGPLDGLAKLVEAAGAPGALPSPPASAAYDARGKGWRMTLQDGTRLEWGGLDWTSEKLQRLREVLADAGARMKPGFTADLRFFADGRILVRD
ncbi:MAG: cell division protein FtsQ, partial [Elusimicrobia bacterium]|nr:cell division protein FtsQ [Elusimicrobiota bacterium]